MVEPDYYIKNGLSPLQAFEQGLLSNEEFIGFCKGNIIKYTVRCDKKGQVLDDIDKAMSYLETLKKLYKFNMMNQNLFTLKNDKIHALGKELTNEEIIDLLNNLNHENNNVNKILHETIMEYDKILKMRMKK